MSDLTTLPTSVRQFLMSAPDQPEADESEHAFRDVVVTLATTNPDLCVALIAAHLNQNPLGAAEAEEAQEKTSNAKYVLGIKYRDDVTTVTRTKRLKRQTG